MGFEVEFDLRAEFRGDGLLVLLVVQDVGGNVVDDVAIHVRTI